MLMEVEYITSRDAVDELKRQPRHAIVTIATDYVQIRMPRVSSLMLAVEDTRLAAAWPRHTLKITRLQRMSLPSRFTNGRRCADATY